MAIVDQKIIVITGAAGGLARAIAVKLGQNSANHLVLSARTMSKAEDAASALRTSSSNIVSAVSCIELDVDDLNSVKLAKENLSNSFGRIDVLVHNAGVSNQDTNLATSISENTKTNAAAPARVTDEFLPLLLQSSDPRLIFITTVLASLTARSDPSHAFYGLDFDGYRASKVALNMIMLSYHKTLKGRERKGLHSGTGVKVLGVCPGFLATDFAAPADYMRSMGAVEPEVGAAVVVEVIDGKRDSDVGHVVAADGVVYPW